MPKSINSRCDFCLHVTTVVPSEHPFVSGYRSPQICEGCADSVICVFLSAPEKPKRKKGKNATR